MNLQTLKVQNTQGLQARRQLQLVWLFWILQARKAVRVGRARAAPRGKEEGWAIQIILLLIVEIVI